MLPKRKSRPITVDGHTFRYVVSWSRKSAEWHDLDITVQSQESNGSKLFARGLVTRDLWLDFPNRDPDPLAYPIVLPYHIKRFILQAVAAGWNYAAPGPDYVLSLSQHEAASAYGPPIERWEREL